MNMSTKYRPGRTAHRRRAVASRSYGAANSAANSGGFSLKPILICALIALAVYMRFSQAPLPQQTRQVVASLISGEVNLKDAVMVFGQKKAPEDIQTDDIEDKKENSILVFGKKLLGISDDNAAPEDEIQQYEPPLPNDFDEISPEQDENAVGDLSDRAFAFMGQISESPMPTFTIPPEVFEIAPEELLDTTPNTEFEIPSPDVVDDTTYQLPFACMAPIKGRITSPFGYRDHPIDTTAKFHYGVDVAANKGVKISAFSAGRVYQTGRNNTYGNFARIDHGNGFTSFYGHMNSITVKNGDWVKMGAEVGKVGSTGNSTGPHLHFEMRKNNMIINPSDYADLSA